jgi:acetyl esterase/lipase
MRNTHHHPALATIAALSALSMAGSYLLPAPARADDQVLSVEASGAVHVPPLILPPSEYWSPEFTSAYAQVARAVTGLSNLGHLPAASAPKSEWDQFDVSCERRSAATLDWERQHYASDVFETQIAGVRVAIVTPKAGTSPQNARRVLIQLRGGACGGLSDGELEALPLAVLGGIKVIVIDYRPAPRNPFPSSIEDVVAVYRELLKKTHPHRIGLFGTSGGGMLTAQTLAWCQVNGLPQPGAVGIFWAGVPASPYPFGRFGDSLLWELGGVPRPDHSNYRAMIASLAEYMRGVDSGDVRAYPGSSDAVLAKFPPTLFVTGGRALDMSAAVTSHARLLKLGVDSQLYFMEGGWHASSFGTRGSSEEHDVNDYIAHWFELHLAR